MSAAESIQLLLPILENCCDICVGKINTIGKTGKRTMVPSSCKIRVSNNSAAFVNSPPGRMTKTDILIVPTDWEQLI